MRATAARRFPVGGSVCPAVSLCALPCPCVSGALGTMTEFIKSGSEDLSFSPLVTMEERCADRIIRMSESLVGDREVLRDMLPPLRTVGTSC
jgi:hypothetical protein